MSARPTPDERFWAKVDKSGTCWEWMASGTVNGYGQITIDGQRLLAHRWSYEQAVGPIPAGLVIDHLCRNRACVRPDHLEAVTAAENNRRGALSFDPTGRCRSGRHSVTGAGATKGRGDGGRQCRECKRETDRAYKRRRDALRRRRPVTILSPGVES